MIELAKSLPAHCPSACNSDPQKIHARPTLSHRADAQVLIGKLRIKKNKRFFCPPSRRVAEETGTSQVGSMGAMSPMGFDGGGRWPYIVTRRAGNAQSNFTWTCSNDISPLVYVLCSYMYMYNYI
jgi:hypothetical protein